MFVASVPRDYRKVASQKSCCLEADRFADWWLAFREDLEVSALHFTGWDLGDWAL